LTPEITAGLKILRHRIDRAKIPSSILDESLNIATWNIREFGKAKRLDASIQYIAEIINQFDLIAMTELRDNTDDLTNVMRVLGPYWDVIYSDWIGDAAGNRERIAYLFDKRMVVFTGLAAEADVTREKIGGKYTSKNVWWRAPYMASFRAGDFDFVMLTSHIRWGGTVKSRKPEIEALAQWVDERRQAPHVANTDFIVAGDFNIPSRRSSLYKAAVARGLQAPAALMKVHDTMVASANAYDQIFCYPSTASRFSDHGGVLDFMEAGKTGWEVLYSGIRGAPRTLDKFTYELSDHLPLWIQMLTDNSEALIDDAL
jgi:endonuclease/exonuclease/phosphatase family metal-dependent hydrolase